MKKQLLHLQQHKIGYSVTMCIIFILLVYPALIGSAKTGKPLPQLIMTSYQKALSRADVKQNTNQEILKQLKGKKPIAFVNGFWVFTFDYGVIYKNPVIYNVLASNLRSDFGVKNTQNLVSAKNFPHTQGMIFIPHNLDVLAQMGMRDLGGFFPGFRVDIMGMFAMWGWRDGGDDNPWPEDPEPWPPEDDDDDDDDDNPWPEDPEPWPPEEDKIHSMHIFNHGVMFNTMVQELPNLYTIMSNTVKAGKTVQLSPTKTGTSINLILPNYGM